MNKLPEVLPMQADYTANLKFEGFAPDNVHITVLRGNIEGFCNVTYAGTEEQGIRKAHSLLSEIIDLLDYPEKVAGISSDIAEHKAKRAKAKQAREKKAMLQAKKDIEAEIKAEQEALEESNKADLEHRIHQKAMELARA